MTDLAQFLQDLQQEVDVIAAEEGREQGLPGAFTEYMIQVLTDAGEIDDGVTAIHESRGRRASGFSIDEDQATLHAFVTDYVPADEIRILGKLEIETSFKRLSAFVTKSAEGLWRQLEESSPVWDMAHRIEEVWPNLTDIRLILLTNADARGAAPSPHATNGMQLTHHIWDLDRLHKLSTSGRMQEPITVDFGDFLGRGIPALGPTGEAGTYDSYVLLMPGRTLADIYEQFGPRLLELNVRSFLQARNKVNRGIQTTLKEEPARFLAYNNGISMTARKVDLEDLPEGGRAIRVIHELQIVNGGQTTASLHYARAKNRANLDSVYIQAKLSVVQPDLLESFVPKISEFANSQNKVNMADFSATDPFHVELEKLSRSVWAPGRDGSHQMTRWFYERARGQYADALARERTPAKQRQFKLIHPLAQKFTKTDLAKFENTWDQLPHIVCLGAEKNFREFTLRFRQRGAMVPDVKYFQLLTSKALLFRKAEKHVGSQRLGGYRSQTVAYTLALILYRSNQRIDLESIWQRQSLSQALLAVIDELAPQVHAQLVRTAGHANISEWAKKPDCWSAMRDLEWELPRELDGELIVHGLAAKSSSGSSITEILTPDEETAMFAVRAVAADRWFELSSWGKQTASLATWQRGLAFSLGKLASNGKAPSRKQALQGAKILDEARRKGFNV